MDWVGIKQKIASFIGQYRYVMLVVLIGLVLMMIPGKEDPTTSQVEPLQESSSTQEDLEDILGQIEGVGNVRVLLTVAAGEQTLYEYNEDSGTDSLQREVVIVSDAERAEQGLIQQVIPPVYQGAIVVCQGGDKPSVRLAVVEAVANATGLGTNQITILKMK